MNITYKGRTQSIREWSKELGIGEKTLRYRICKGWEPEQILGFQKRENKIKPYKFLRYRKLEYSGEVKSYLEWEAVTGTPAMIIYTRVKRGWGVEAALFAPKWIRLEDYEWGINLSILLKETKKGAPMELNPK